MKRKYALITLSDKTGSGELARDLESLGYTILSTSNTARHLRQYCRKVVEVSDLTGFPEILDGRVKTLHPVIHAGILADRSKAEHLKTLEDMGIEAIDLVAVNLYPFAQTVAKAEAGRAEIIENIDIGGPTLLRAAAKNHEHVLILTDPADYPDLCARLSAGQPLDLQYRQYLAAKAFRLVAEYDFHIAAYLSGAEKERPLPQSGEVQVQTLRYGENPHQTAAFLTSQPTGWQVLHGKELSFNNLLDLDAVLRALALFERPSCVIVKHCNPCGIGSADALCDAYQLALAADPVSPYGGIVGLNRALDMATAEAINRLFTELVIAPDFAPGVLDFLRKKKDRRIIQIEVPLAFTPDSPAEEKKLLRGFLRQAWDTLEDRSGWRVVSARQPSETESEALGFAWKVVSLLRSNAIAVTGGDRVFGLGSGQTSRIDSTQIALSKARQFGHDLSGAVCASDGYFPFPDSLDELQRRGIRAVIQPGGSKGDQEVIKACDAYGMAMIFTGVRHFKH